MNSPVKPKRQEKRHVRRHSRVQTLPATNNSQEGRTMKPATPVTALTMCRLCNQPVMQGPPIIGESEDSHAMRVMQSLVRHLQHSHPAHMKEIAQRVQVLSMSLYGIQVVQSYEIADPVMLLEYDKARAPLHALTRKKTLTDAQLETVLGEKLAPGPFNSMALKAAMPIAKWLRDFLSEEGEFEHPTVKQARESTVAIKTA